MIVYEVYEVHEYNEYAQFAFTDKHIAEQHAQALQEEWDALLETIGDNDGGVKHEVRELEVWDRAPEKVPVARVIYRLDTDGNLSEQRQEYDLHWSYSPVAAYNERPAEVTLNHDGTAFITAQAEGTAEAIAKLHAKQKEALGNLRNYMKNEPRRKEKRMGKR